MPFLWIWFKWMRPLQKDKMHPLEPNRDPNAKGRVRVQLHNDDGTPFNEKFPTSRLLFSRFHVGIWLFFSRNECIFIDLLCCTGLSDNIIECWLLRWLPCSMNLGNLLSSIYFYSVWSFLKIIAAVVVTVFQKRRALWQADLVQLNHSARLKKHCSHHRMV